MGNCKQCCAKHIDNDLYKHEAEEMEMSPMNSNLDTPYKVNAASHLTGTFGKDASRDITRPSVQAMDGYGTISNLHHLGTGIKYETDARHLHNVIVPPYDQSRTSSAMHSQADGCLQTPTRVTLDIGSQLFAGMPLAEIADLKMRGYLNSIPNSDKIKVGLNQVYEGEVKDGRPAGKGVLVVDQTEIFIGCFKNSKLVYKVEYFSLAKNTHYCGLIDESLKYTGFGTLTRYPSKQTYSGEFKNGLPHGEGQETDIYRPGVAYIGEFVNGARANKGMIVRLTDGAVLETLG